LRFWQQVELAEHGRAQLMESSEREFHLGLNSSDLSDPEP
jgi:hypothetical protein